MLAASPSAAQRPALSRADVEAWLDGFLPNALEHADIAGAVVVVVKDGHILVERGYGFADVARRTPVDPERTLFRPGSVSKLFTWTAVMQLVEQGKLDLDRDINEYLDFTIPPRAGRPITLRNAMTHTTGFEQPIKNSFLPDTTVIDLRSYLTGWVPERIFPPGEVPAYSNYATALAGYVVQRVSGEPYDDYIERHIFATLGMEHSTFRQPLPAALRPLMSNGYSVGSEPAKSFETIAQAPAGSLTSTGSDMARFMIAHLQGGAFGSARILEPATARMMHGTPLTIIPPLSRMLLGFYEADRNGHRVIAHGGDTGWFHSDLRLLIDDGVGFFISMNSAGRDYAHYFMRNALFEEFTDRYFPAPGSDPAADSPTGPEHARAIAGLYESSRGSASNFLRISSLLGPVEVVARRDGTISTGEFVQLNGQPKQWREIAPFVWRNVDGNDRLAAKVVNGKVVMWSGDEVSAAVVFLPIPAWRSPAWLMPAVLASLAILTATGLQWPIAALARRRFGRPSPLAGNDLLAYRLVRASAIAILGVVLAWNALLGTLGSEALPATTAADWLLWILQLGTLVVFVGAALAAGWNAKRVWAGRRSRFRKLWSTGLLIACLAMLFTAFVFKLIAFDVNY
ncbi:MAG: serine hydrolase domain-containing protein [Gemmatimonadota bacterium]